MWKLIKANKKRIKCFACKQGKNFKKFKEDTNFKNVVEKIKNK